MKTILMAASAAFALTAAVAVAGPALAQAEAATPAKAAFSSQTPIEVLMTNPLTRPVMDKHFPDLEENPLYDALKSKSLREIAPMTAGAIKEEQLDRLDADLATVKP